MDKLLCKIRALQATNTGIIQRIDSRPSDATTIWYSYEEAWDIDHMLKVVEHAQVVSTKLILEQWSTANNMELDLWRRGTTNSLPDWSSPALTWDSLKSINTEMLQDVENLSKLLDPNPDNQEPQTELRKYLENYEKLQVALFDLEETTTGKPSQLVALQAAATSVNEARQDWKTKLLQIPKLPPYLESVIVSAAESSVLQSWYCNGGSEVRLLYRGSRDGMETSTFHRLCDDKGPTITIVKSTDGFVFGGYTMASWAGRAEYKACGKSSLFTLRTPQEGLPQRFSLNRATAILTDPGCGPTFGADLSTGVSGTIGHGASTLFAKRGNPLFAGKQLFSVAEIEVFAVA